MKGGTSKRNLIKIASLSVVMLSTVLVCTFQYKLFHPSSLWYVAFLAGSFLLIWALIGFHWRRQYDGGTATQIVLIYVLFYLLLIYMVGLVTGFLRNGYSLAPVMIVKNVLPLLGAAVLTEMLRYAMVKRVGNSRLMLVLIAALFSAIGIAVGLTTYSLSTPLDVFEMVGRLVMGGIATSAMLTLVAYKSDWRPTVVYAAIMAIYPVVVPILPDLGQFIYSVLAIVLPLVMLMRFNEFFATKRALPTRHSRCGKWLALTPMLAVLVVIVVLVSGVFRYWSTAIGSSSMAPNINMGDVVVIDKDYGDADAIETGSVIAFRHDNRVVVHRLVAIHNSADGLELQTKGDNNASEDAYIVHENDLVGVVRWRLPLIGWPTVWIDQTF